MILSLLPEEVASLANYDPDERRVSIFADSRTGLADALAVAEQVGARVLFSGSAAAASERLNDYPPGDVVLVDIAHGTDAAMQVMLDRLDALARHEQTPMLINVAPECLDDVAARMTAPSVTIMSQATRSDWIASLAITGRPGALIFHDIAVDDTLRLQRFADEVQRIARTLADMVGNDPPGMRAGNDGLIGFRADPIGFSPQPAGSVTANEVRAMIRARRTRDRFFRSDLFADPAWDMLLDLLAARLEHMRVAVSSLCIAAAVPPTTALRWIKTLSDAGMFVRVADPRDGRRVFIALSDATAAAMTNCLAAMKGQGGLAI